MGNTASQKTADIAALIIGLAPVWMVLLPLDITSAPLGWQAFVRAHSFAVPVIQLIFVLIAMGIGFSPFQAISRLPRLSQFSIIIWLILAIYVSFQSGKDHLSAAIGIMKLMIASLFLLALIDLRNIFRSRFLATLWISIGCGTLLYILLWTIHILTLSPQGEEWIVRIPGVNNVRHVGHFAFASVTAGLFCLIAFRHSPKILLRWALPILFGSAGLGLSLWTGSRGPLLASVITIFVTICIADQQRRTVATFFIGSALAATATVSLLPVPHEIYGIAGATGMADVAAQGEHDASSGRGQLWNGTIEKIIEKPLLGWGIHQFNTFGPSKPNRFLHPHNLPLQMMFAGGIISVLLTMLIAFPALRRWQWPDWKGSSAAGIGCLVGMLTYSLYDGALFFSYPTMIFLVAIATSITPPQKRSVPDM